MVDIVSDPQMPVAPKPAQAVTHVDALRPGTRLAEFEVQGLLGVGGFGLVYRAYDTSLHRTVAIKEYMPAALAARLDGTSVSVRSSADQATYQSGLDSFVAEARLLARFDHPSLVKVYRFWEGNNTAYMVMPLYSGMTLSQARSQMAAPPPEAWLRTVLWSILQALHVLHQNDTLHRDISPDNIFLQDIGPPVLLDLGAARRAINDKPHKHTAVLKVNYAPIEQYGEAEDLTQGPWTDLYALAAVVYSCLRNAPPSPATTRVVRDTMPTVRSVAATVKEHFGTAYSDQFVRTITHALAVQPGDRPQSLAAFVTEMKLKAPPRLSKFDWRNELGVVLKSDQDENSSRQFWNTQPQTVPDPTRRGAGGRTGRPAGRVAQAGRRLAQALSQHAKPLGLGLAALLVAGGGLLWLLPADNGGSLWGTAPVVATPDPAVMPAPAAAPAASEPQAVDPLAMDAAPAPAPAPIVKPPAAERRTAPAVRTPAAQQPAAEEEERKPPARARAANPEPAPKPPVRTDESRVAPRELCANANFFTRPMCIHEECQKPANTQLPVCIENRKQYPNGPSGSNAAPAF
jgi:non-specific serine/threonine protein kinase